MATYTSHYNLKKPALSDKIRIADFNGNADTIDATMYDNATLIASLKSDIGIVENTNTATHNISAGQYVIWQGLLYTASSAISSGATLSDANLTAVSGGGLNALNGNVTTWESVTPSFPAGASDTQYTHVYKNNGTKIVYAQIYATFANGVTSGGTICDLPTPLNGASNLIIIDFYGSTFTPIAARFDGTSLKIRGGISAGHTVLGSIVYVAQ